VSHPILYALLPDCVLPTRGSAAEDFSGVAHVIEQRFGRAIGPP
jgi:hypothetical protein